MHVFRKPETIPLYESSLEEASDTETTYSTLFGSSDQYDTWSASDRDREIPPLRKKRPHTIGPLSITSINLKKIYSTQESSSSDNRRQRSQSQSSCRYVPLVKFLEFEEKAPVKRLMLNLKEKEPITGSTYRQLMLAQSRLTLAVVIDEGVPYIFNAPQLGKWNPDTITRNPITNNRIENIWWFASDSENHEFAFIGSTKDSSREIGSRINQQSPRRRNSKGSFIQKIGSQIKMPLG